MWWLNNGHHCPNSAVNTSNALLADVDNEFPAYRSTLGFFIDHDTFFLVAYLLRSARNLNFPNAFVQIASR